MGVLIGRQMTVRKPLAVFQAEGVHEKVKNVENVEMRRDGRGD